MRTSAHPNLVGFLLAGLLVCSSCSTVNVTHREQYHEGPEIKGTERYWMKVDRYAREARGREELVTIVPDSIERRYKVEHWRKQWDVVERRRHCSVIGVHPEYDPIKEVSMDLICGGLLLVTSPLGVPISLIDSDKDFLLRIAGSSVSILPFVTTEIPSVTETVEKHVDLRKVDPISKVDRASFSQLADKRFDWIVLRPDGTRQDRGRVRGNTPIKIPWVDWTLDQPDVPFWNISVSSSDLDLVGNLDGVLDVDLRDALWRQWPDEEGRPLPSLKVQHAIVDATTSNRLERLGTGKCASVSFEVKSGMFSSPAYMLEAFVECPAVSNLVVAVPPPRRWLKRWSEAQFAVPIQIPLMYQEDGLQLLVGVRDVFGRVYGAATQTVAVVQTPLPDLAVHTAEIRRGAGSASTGELLATIRNRGAGAAEDVRIAVLSATTLDDVVLAEGRIARIEPFDRNQVSLTVRIPASLSPVVPVRLRLSELLGVPPVEVKLEVPFVD